MSHPQEGWLQLDLANREATPVEFFAFSNQGVGVILMADDPLQQEARALLVMQAHGAGLSHRPVRLCWHRPHPQDPQRQLAGLPCGSPYCSSAMLASVFGAWSQ